MAWKLTMRTGGAVKRQRFADLNAALEHAETEARVAAQNAPNAPVDAKIRSFTPAQQVLARIEIAGPERLLPKVRAGIDVHGDGSAEAYLGRVRRQAITLQRRESPYDALRRTLGSTP